MPNGTPLSRLVPDDPASRSQLVPTEIPDTTQDIKKWCPTGVLISILLVEWYDTSEMRVPLRLESLHIMLLYRFHPQYQIS